MNDTFNAFFENRPTKLKLEIENKKMTHEMNTGKKHSEIGSLMDVMRENSSIRKTILNLNSPISIAQLEKMGSARGINSFRRRKQSDEDSEEHYRKESNNALNLELPEIELTPPAILP